MSARTVRLRFLANPKRRRLNRLPAFPADGAVRAPSLAYLFHWKRVIAARLCGGLGETALPAARPHRSRCGRTTFNV